MIVVCFAILMMGASSHNIPKSTFIWAFSWLITLFVIYFLIIYFFKNQDKKIKKKLFLLSKSISKFENSKEHEWFLEYIEKSELRFAFDTIEDYLKATEIILNPDSELAFKKIKKITSFY